METLTLPALLKRNAQTFGDKRAAIREKQFGIWQSVTWRGYYENVRDFALGLRRSASSGATNSATWETTGRRGSTRNWPSRALGGAIVGIYPDSHLEQVEYIVNHSDSTFVVAGDQEQADKILDIKERCPKVLRVIVDDPKGMRHYDDPILTYFKDVQKLGRAAWEKEPQLFDRLIDQVSSRRRGDDQLHLRDNGPAQGEHDHPEKHGECCKRPGLGRRRIGYL